MALLAGEGTALAAPPPNDSFANALALSPANGTPANATGSTTEATREAGEPVHAGSVGGRSIWFTWTATTSRRVRISACGSSIDTLLAVYTGHSVGSLGRVAENDDNASCSNGTRSRVDLNVWAGQTYRIAVESKSGAQGSVAVSVSDLGPRSPDNDDFLSAADTSPAAGLPVLTPGSNLGATSESGEPAHDGTARRSVWYRWTATETVTIEAAVCAVGTDMRIAVYQGGSLSTLNPVPGQRTSCPSNAGRGVVFEAVAGQTYRIAVDGPSPGAAFALYIAKQRPTLSIGDVSIAEGDTGQTQAVVAATLSKPAETPISAGYETTTFPGYEQFRQFESAVGQLTIPAGETTGRFTVQVNGDIDVEDDEEIGVRISGPTSVVLGAAEATITIVDDDVPPPDGWDCNSFYCLAPGQGPVRMSRSDQPSELVKTIPITRGGRSRTVMEIGPNNLGGVAEGDSIVASGEVEVSVTCLEQMKQCVGSRYGYSPRVSGKLVLKGGSGKAGRTKLSRTHSLTCSQALPHRNHHCVLFLPPSRTKVPPGCEDCRVTLVLSASHRNARPGNKLVIGSDGDHGIEQDKGHLNAIVIGADAEEPTTDTARERLENALPVGRRSSGGRKQVVFSQRIDGLQTHEQVFVDARALVRTSHLRYGTFIGAELVLSDGPNGVKPENGNVESALVTEKNGFNCTRGRSAHDNPCLVRKAGFFRVKRRTNGPTYVNLVVQTAAAFGGRWHAGDRAKVLGRGGITTDRYGPLGWARIALPPK